MKLKTINEWNSNKSINEAKGEKLQKLLNNEYTSVIDIYKDLYQSGSELSSDVYDNMDFLQTELKLNSVWGHGNFEKMLAELGYKVTKQDATKLANLTISGGMGDVSYPAFDIIYAIFYSHTDLSNYVTDDVLKTLLNGSVLSNSMDTAFADSGEELDMFYTMLDNADSAPASNSTKQIYKDIVQDFIDSVE